MKAAVKYNFLCVVFKLQDQDHFASIFALDSRLYLIDDLKPYYEEVTGDVEVVADIYMFIKKYD